MGGSRFNTIAYLQTGSRKDPQRRPRNASLVLHWPFDVASTGQVGQPIKRRWHSLTRRQFGSRLAYEWEIRSPQSSRCLSSCHSSTRGRRGLTELLPGARGLEQIRKARVAVITSRRKVISAR